MARFIVVATFLDGSVAAPSILSSLLPPDRRVLSFCCITPPTFVTQTSTPPKNEAATTRLQAATTPLVVQLPSSDLSPSRVVEPVVLVPLRPAYSWSPSTTLYDVPPSLFGQSSGAHFSSVEDKAGCCAIVCSPRRLWFSAPSRQLQPRSSQPRLP